MLILSYITGREWDYVMISLVRTLPSNKIEKNPDTDWIQRHVGEMSDINQINLMLTRARCGLVLIGRSTLMLTRARCGLVLIGRSTLMLTRARCGLVLIGRSTLIHIIFS
jgi:superfamily I DNA and/or RNA helicase